MSSFLKAFLGVVLKHMELPCPVRDYVSEKIFMCSSECTSLCSYTLPMVLPLCKSFCMAVSTWILCLTLKQASPGQSRFALVPIGSFFPAWKDAVISLLAEWISIVLRGACKCFVCVFTWSKSILCVRRCWELRFFCTISLWSCPFQPKPF